MEDRDLLRAYLDRQSEHAFAELVARHVNLVYSTALRHVREPETARDVAQTVFIHLAQKGHAIRAGDALAGWLYRVTCYTAINAVRAERRWRHRENQAVNPAAVQDTTRAWDALAPLLDEAMERLNRTEQDALVLRFFEGQSLREIGSALAMTEAAVQKRVSRALEKLRSHFSRRGFSVSSGVIAAAIAAHSTHAAPLGLAATLAGTSLSATASAGLPWFFNFIQLMTATKLKVSVAALCIVAAVSTPILLHRTSSPPASTVLTSAQVPAVAATAVQVAAPPLLAVTRSVDDVVSGLQRLLTDGDYGRRYAGLKDLADSVAVADIPNAILRADRLSDPLLKSPFILLLLSRLAQSNPALAMECAQRASTTHEGVRTVMDQWVQQDAAGATAWVQASPAHDNLWPYFAFRSTLLLALANRDPEAALALADTAKMQGGGDKAAWYASVFEKWATKDLRAALARAENLPPGTLRTRVLSTVAGAWAQTDPAAAASYAASLTDVAARKDMIEHVAMRWADVNASAAADWVRTLPAGVARANAAFHVSERLALSNPAAAAELAVAEVGQHPHALGRIAGTWAKTDLPKAVEWMKNLPEGRAKHAVLSHVVVHWAQSDPQAAADYAMSLPDVGEMSGRTGAPLRSEAINDVIRQWAQTDPRAALAWSREHGDAGLGTIIENWARNEPLEAGHFVSSLPAGDEQNAAAAHVASIWAKSDPNGAADWVAQFPEGSYRDRAVRGLVSSWASNDVVGAAAWLGSGVADKVREQAVPEFVWAAAHSTPELAAQWVGQVPNPQQRHALMETVAREWMLRDELAAKAWVRDSSLPADSKQRWLSWRRH